MEKLNLSGKTVFVTGASRGIGEVLCYALAKEGAKVACVARDYGKLEKICGKIKSDGGTAIPIECDLYDEEQIINAIETVKSSFGEIDILINNAGLLMLKKITETTAEEYDKIMNVNMKAVFITCREILKSMEERKSGTIVNIGSLAGKRGYTEQSIYCASKHALAGFTKALAMEAHPFGIRVHLLSPGGVFTDMTEDLRKSRGAGGNECDWMTCAEVAEGVMYLLSQTGVAFTDELVMRRFASQPLF